MESSIIESSVNLQEVLADGMINGFLATVIQVMFFSPVSILVYGGIAILILFLLTHLMRGATKGVYQND